MNIEKLKEFLSGKILRPHAIRILDVAGAEDAFCIVKLQGNWHVFYTERGERLHERVFSSEAEACEYFLYIVQRGEALKPEFRKS